MRNVQFIKVLPSLIIFIRHWSRIFVFSSLLVANFVFRMNISLSSTDSARLPDYPMVSPDNRQQLTVEPLSTKRERVSTLKFKNRVNS